MSIIPRDIPSDVKRQLREESGHRCAVCGNPFLAYHHFDPPWHVENHHRPVGMVALCLEHAGIADGGGFTDRELREFKATPWSKRNPESAVGGTFTWKRKNLLLWTGTGLFLQVRTLVRMGMDIIWTEDDSQGRALVNVELRSEDGGDLLRMRNNDWLAYDFTDLVCGARASNMDIRSGAARLKLSWHYLTRDKLFGRLESAWGRLEHFHVAALDHIFEDGKATLLHLTGNIRWPREMQLQRDKIVVRRGFVIRNAFIGNCNVAFDV